MQDRKIVLYEARVRSMIVHYASTAVMAQRSRVRKEHTASSLLSIYDICVKKYMALAMWLDHNSGQLLGEQCEGRHEAVT